MSAININNQIPNTIVTLEQLHVWSGLALSFIHPNTKVLETEVGSVHVMQNGTFQAQDGTERIFIRSSIELEPEFKFDNSKKLWMFAKELGQIVVPAGFTNS